VRFTFTVPVTVAFADIVIVEPVEDTIVAPVAIPVPLMGCPVITPARLDTAVRMGLPKVVRPVGAGVIVLVVVPFADIVTVLVPIAETVVPGVMPGAARGCPTNNPVVLDTSEMVVLPEVTMPENMATEENGLEAVAFADMVSVVAPIAVMVVPAVMPVPVIVCPVASPVLLDTAVIVLLPVVRTPVVETALVAVAATDIVIVVPLAAVMVAVEGIPVPVMGCPTVRKVSPLALETPVIVVLPEVT